MKLEHANITVPDIDQATEFLMTAFPDAEVRGGGVKASTGRVWRHVGNQETYIALQQEVEVSESNRRDYIDNGVNHLGFVVDDVNRVSNALKAAGYKISIGGVDEEGRTSAYFYDNAGFEWEFVEYHSADNAIKNNYQ